MTQPPDKKTQNIIKLLKAFQNIDPEFPLQYALCLLEISRENGLSLTELAQKTNLTLSTISRIIGALSDNRQKGKPYGLVKVTISKTERRRKELTLTAKGQKLIQSLHALS